VCDRAVGDEVVDALHGWGLVSELEPGIDGEVVATVSFPGLGEARLRASRLYAADL
jgi:hypothetical protein